MAVIGQLLTIAVVHFGFDIRLPLDRMLATAGFLIVFNIVSLGHWHRRREAAPRALLIALLVDVGTLTLQLYWSGGASNPFVFLYLLQVILGAVLLSARPAWIMVAVTAGCFVGLVFLHHPLPMSAGGSGIGDPYIQGLLICFVLNAALLVLFITRISRNLRARDAYLADLRQRAAEEEHIVRMGLLASGAAHELGTPLATLAVIVGDWRRLPHFSSDAELLDELDEMQTQLQRCKAIVSGILLSAGEARGESSSETTMRAFLDDVVTDWRNSRPVATVDYDNAFHDDIAIVSDSALRQMICNVLDNALEASPGWVGVCAARDGDRMQLTISDAGPGFTPEMLANLGKPYRSTKGRPGSGLGLFLSVNVARTLGGSLVARNRAEGGGVVTLRLPLQSIRLEADDGDGA